VGRAAALATGSIIRNLTPRRLQATRRKQLLPSNASSVNRIHATAEAASVADMQRI